MDASTRLIRMVSMDSRVRLTGMTFVTNFFACSLQKGASWSDRQRLSEQSGLFIRLGFHNQQIDKNGQGRIQFEFGRRKRNKGNITRVSGRMSLFGDRLGDRRERCGLYAPSCMFHTALAVRGVPSV